MDVNNIVIWRSSLSLISTINFLKNLSNLLKNLSTVRRRGRKRGGGGGGGRRGWRGRPRGRTRGRGGGIGGRTRGRGRSRGRAWRGRTGGGGGGGGRGGGRGGGAAAGAAAAGAAAPPRIFSIAVLSNLTPVVEIFTIFLVSLNTSLILNNSLVILKYGYIPSFSSLNGIKTSGTCNLVLIHIFFDNLHFWFDESTVLYNLYFSTSFRSL